MIFSHADHYTSDPDKRGLLQKRKKLQQSLSAFWVVIQGAFSEERMHPPKTYVQIAQKKRRHGVRSRAARQGEENVTITSSQRLRDRHKYQRITNRYDAGSISIYYQRLSVKASFVPSDAWRKRRVKRWRFTWRTDDRKTHP